MAITGEDFLHIQKGASTYLLLRSPSHFHLIREDASLTESKLSKLLRVYPCDVRQLQQMGIHFSAFKAENLCGVVIKGYKTGDALELWLGGDIRDYQLGDDYSEQVLSTFFSGYQIWNCIPPKWEGLDLNLIQEITWSLNSFSIACSVIFYFFHTPYWLWSILCILCQFSAIILPIIYPESFSLADVYRKEKISIPKGKGNLFAALVPPGLAMTLRTLSDFTFGNSALGWMLLISGGIYLLLFLPIIRISRHTRHRIIGSLGIVIAMVFLGMGTVGQLNYLLDYGSSDSQVLEVVDKRMSRGPKSTSYYCNVLLPNGDTMELTMSFGTYRDVEIGDNVTVTSYSGAFGIPFFIVDSNLMPTE